MEGEVKSIQRKALLGHVEKKISRPRLLNFFGPSLFPFYFLLATFEHNYSDIKINIIFPLSLIRFLQK